jgi:hypothetical protein
LFFGAAFLLDRPNAIGRDFILVTATSRAATGTLAIAERQELRTTIGVGLPDARSEDCLAVVRWEFQNIVWGCPLLVRAKDYVALALGIAASGSPR